jgi:hypothetical protein
MVLSIHIIVAITSLVIGGIAAFRPGRRVLSTNYAFIAATFASGILLIIQQPVHLAAACMSGLAYLAVVAVLTIIAHRRLVRATT